MIEEDVAKIIRGSSQEDFTVACTTQLSGMVGPLGLSQDRLVNCQFIFQLLSTLYINQITYNISKYKT